MTLPRSSLKSRKKMTKEYLKITGAWQVFCEGKGTEELFRLPAAMFAYGVLCAMRWTCGDHPEGNESPATIALEDLGFEEANQEEKSKLILPPSAGKLVSATGRLLS